MRSPLAVLGVLLALGVGPGFGARADAAGTACQNGEVVIVSGKAMTCAGGRLVVRLGTISNARCRASQANLLHRGYRCLDNGTARVWTPAPGTSGKVAPRGASPGDRRLWTLYGYAHSKVCQRLLTGALDVLGAGWDAMAVDEAYQAIDGKAVVVACGLRVHADPAVRSQGVRLDIMAYDARYRADAQTTVDLLASTRTRLLTTASGRTVVLSVSGELLGTDETDTLNSAADQLTGW